MDSARRCARFAFWGFLVLGLTILEAFGALFIPDFAVPFVGRWAVVGFLEDLFGVLVIVGIVMFIIIRLINNPDKLGRRSRFFGSHTGAAWLVLFMIFNVIWTLFPLPRGAVGGVRVQLRAQPGPKRPIQQQNFLFYESGGAFFSEWVGNLLYPLGLTANMWLETIGIWLNIGVILVFLIFVLHSKHLHIFMAPINVYFSRRPNALGPLLPPMYSNGEKIDFEDPADDALFGRVGLRTSPGKTCSTWATCTECGRCQSQCPAWNTDKPLSPRR